MPSAKINETLAALATFKASDSHDTVACLLLLAQLDPKSVEFAEMARQQKRRKSSSRKSKGSSDQIFENLEMMEDVPLAGRKDELVVLIRAANVLRTSSSENMTVIIEAAGGMGKSALLKSFVKDAQASMRIQIRCSAASQFEKQSAFFPWKNIFSSILCLYTARSKGRDSGSRELKRVSQEVLLTHLGDIVGDNKARSLHPLLNPLLDLDSPDTPETAALGGSARLEQTLELMHEILVHSESTLICIEDAHWADELSWELIKRAHAAPNVLVVVTSRPEHGNAAVGEKDELKELLGLEGVQHMVLGALEPSALRKHMPWRRPRS